MGFRNIRVTDCELDCRVPVTKRHPYIDVPGLATTQTGAAGLSVLMVDGGYAEDIVYSRIKMKRGIMSPIWIRLDKRNENKDGKEIRTADYRVQALERILKINEEAKEFMEDVSIPNTLQV